MTTIYLIRHAEAEGNLYRRIQGQYDSLVTNRGFSQIKALEKRFEGVGIDAVYASDLTRTQVTASAITRPRNLPLTTLPQLREVDMGVWEDKPWGEMEYEDAQMIWNFNHAPDKWIVPEAERMADLRVRIAKTLQTLSEKHKDQTIAVFSHGCAIRHYLLHMSGFAASDIRKIPHGDNTAVSRITIDGDRWSADLLNDNSHLTEETSTLMGQSWWKNEESREPSNFYYRPFDPKKTKNSTWLATKTHGKGFTGISGILTA